MKKLPVFLYPAVNKCARQECFHRYFTEQVRRHSMRSFFRLCPTGMCGLKSLHLTFPAAAKKKAPPVLYPLSCGHRPYGALFPCGFAVTVSYHIVFRLTHPHGCRFAVFCLRQMLTETKTEMPQADAVWPGAASACGSVLKKALYQIEAYDINFT